MPSPIRPGEEDRVAGGLLADRVEQNRRWTIGLMVVAAVNAGLVVYLIGSTAPSLLLILVAVMAGSVALTYFFYVQLVTRSTGAREPTESEGVTLRPLVARVAHQFGHQPPRILVLDEDAVNAFAVGAREDESIICFTTGILARLDEEQLEAVAAHEMSHIVNGDTKVSLISASLLGWALVVSWIGSIIALAVAAMGLGMLSRGGSNDDWTATLVRICVGLGLVIAAVMAWIGLQAWVLIARIADLAIHRQREYLADASAVQTTGNVSALISALRALDGESAVLKKGHSLAQPLCAAGDPRTGSAWRDLMSTHPSMDARVERLRAFGHEIAQTVASPTLPVPVAVTATVSAFASAHESAPGSMPLPVTADWTPPPVSADGGEAPERTSEPVAPAVQTMLREDSTARTSVSPLEPLPRPLGLAPVQAPSPTAAAAEIMAVEPTPAYTLANDEVTADADADAPLSPTGCLVLPLWLADAVRFFETRSAGAPELVAALAARPAAEGGWPVSVTKIGASPWALANQGSTAAPRPGPAASSGPKTRFGPGLRPWALFETGSSPEPPSSAEVDELRAMGLADDGSILVRHGVIDRQERFRAWQLGQSPAELQVCFSNRPLEVVPRRRDGGVS